MTRPHLLAAIAARHKARAALERNDHRGHLAASRRCTAAYAQCTEDEQTTYAAVMRGEQPDPTEGT